MRTLELKEDDLIIQNNSFVWLDKKACCCQRLRIALAIWQGEWLLNPEGIAWIRILEDKSSTDRLIRSEIERILLQDPEVVSVNNITLEYVPGTRELNIHFSVNTVYGEVNE